MNINRILITRILISAIQGIGLCAIVGLAQHDETGWAYVIGIATVMFAWIEGQEGWGSGA